MTNDGYLYRKSGVYSISEVTKTRRKMFGFSQEDLTDDNISLSTVKRAESPKKNINPSKFRILFDKLSLYPSYINLGIVTDKREAVDMYEELRFAVTRFEYEKIDTLISLLRNNLPKHKLNEQTLNRIESLNAWRQGRISDDEYIQNLTKTLQLTIGLNNIQNSNKIFLTTEELTSLMSISVVYKNTMEYEKAKEYIKEIEEYMKEIEETKVVDGRMGIYEMVMEYIGSLYGDMGMYETSNEISHKLIKMSLKLRRSDQIHSSFYNKAWNNHECERKEIDYHAELQKCIIFSQLSGDTSSEDFYKRKLTVW